MSRLSLAFALLSLGCGTTLYRPGTAARFDPLPAREITDDDVRLAFEASPQMRTPLRVAYYTLDPERAGAIEAMLAGLEGVEATYRIPPLLVTGARRFEEEREAREIGLRQLRLHAARARCDVLVVFDQGHRITERPNGLAALNVFLVTAFFVPFIDTQVESYLDAYVIDTRNGYLYGQLESREERTVAEQTLWSDAGREIAREHWAVLLERTREALAGLIRSSRAGDGCCGVEAR